jgi:hypothetical protein
MVMVKVLIAQRFEHLEGTQCAKLLSNTKPIYLRQLPVERGQKTASDPVARSRLGHRLNGRNV